MKIPYSSPRITTVGDIRRVTQSGSPNQAYDGGGLFDISFGPRDGGGSPHS